MGGAQEVGGSTDQLVVQLWHLGIAAAPLLGIMLSVFLWLRRDAREMMRKSFGRVWRKLEELDDDVKDFRGEIRETRDLVKKMEGRLER